MLHNKKKPTFIPAKKIKVNVPVDAFTLMNKQYLNNAEINQLKPYLNSVALQNQYEVAAIRAQLALGWIYAQKAYSTKLLTKQFYALKAKQYLSTVALQDLYPKGQQCAIALLQSLIRI